MAELSNRLSTIRGLLADATDMSSRDGNWVTTGEANDLAFQYDLDRVSQSDLNELVRLKLADKKGINFFRIRQSAGAALYEGDNMGPREAQDGYPDDQWPGDEPPEPRGTQDKDPLDETPFLAAGGGGSSGVAGAVTQETIRQIL